jgi:hypothetical protein
VLHAKVGALGLIPLMLVEGLNRRLGISDRLFVLVDSALLSSVGQWVRRYCVGVVGASQF